MAVGKTYEIVNWDGKKGECRNGHEIIPMSNGFAFCIECSKLEDGYSSLYKCQEMFLQLPKNDTVQKMFIVQEQDHNH